MSAPSKSFWLPLASLRLTVVLMAMAIFLIFVGTLAQKDHDIWFVVEKSYFRVWWASIEWQVFYRLVELFTKAEPQPVSGGFWFPGGLLIGTMMAINLVTAHTLRFRVTAKGSRLTRGLVMLLVGLLATGWVISSGMGDAAVSQLSPTFSEGLWQALRATIAGIGLAGVYWAIGSYGQIRKTEWAIATSVAILPLIVAAWLYANPDARIDDAGLRILWLLTKVSFASAVLFAGCYQLFNKRAGIVLLHAGIGLLMVGELLTGLTSEEAQMSIAEGQTVNYAYDIRTTELAVVTTTLLEEGKQRERVTVIPQDLLAKHANSGELITNKELPFDLRVKAFYLNSQLTDTVKASSTPEWQNLATVGAGKISAAIALKSTIGTDSNAGANQPSAYVEIVHKDEKTSSKRPPLGVWLVSASSYPHPDNRSLSPQTIATAPGAPTISLRFKRNYKPYSITLKKFSFDRYVGTQKPKNFSSSIILRDPSHKVERDLRIWMNNPLRYAGDTLYQSSYDGATETTTIFQVMTNGGWMIPYVSCVMVGLGLLVHFGISLARFARRRQEEAIRIQKAEEKNATEKERISWLSPLVIAPMLAALLCGGYLASKARPADDGDSPFHLQSFGQLPVVDGGRVKPIDTFARNVLQHFSERQEVIAHKKYGKGLKENLSATQWMLESISGLPVGRTRPVFRIVNLELLELLELSPRPGYFRYSFDEILAKREILAKQLDLTRASETAGNELTIVQKKTVVLAQKLSNYNKMVNAFDNPKLGGDPDKIAMQVEIARSQAQDLNRHGAVRCVLPTDASNNWKTLFESDLLELFRMARQSASIATEGLPPANQATAAWSEVLTAYAKQDAEMFNQQLKKLETLTAEYEERIQSNNAEGLARAEILNRNTIRFEHFFQNFSPFYYCAVMYLFAFVLTACSWLGWPRTLGRTATTIILITLLVHTFALVGRIYISGRPPVTNLYSSAIFIGWAAVLLGLAMEAISRIGIGNAVASILGFSTLIIAQQLSLDGDTFTVMQAVLDTQFWLATHVVCITIGYSTTFLAGTLGILYLLGGHLLGKFGDKESDQIIRMMYGTLCFALFFSFIGTVLGGLWADDSWGRFWGWDPKENGALIIVLWNALVLHARWGKMVGPRGLAMLCVAGNIATAWSWFGVNELGEGLHAYGFTEGRAFWLLQFLISQLIVIALGGLPPLSKKSRPAKGNQSISK